MAKFALKNVRIFNGKEVTEAGTVVIDGSVIGVDQQGAEVIDCNNSILFPGFIDAHIHLDGVDTLQTLCRHGVTTGLDMGSFCDRSTLRDRAGVADFRSAGIPAAAPESLHSKWPTWPKDQIIADVAGVAGFIEERLVDDVDYIKIIADVPGFDQLVINALAQSAREAMKLSVAHAAHTSAYARAADAKVDIVTHVPLDGILPESTIAALLESSIVSVPTITMMKGIAVSRGIDAAHANIQASVAAMHKAGVPLLAGTDSNTVPGAPAVVPHGESLHGELAFLVEAGLTPLEALLAATELPAKHFGLYDRGRVAAGLRADLVLLKENPLVDIANSRTIERVWCAGVEVQNVASKA